MLITPACVLSLSLHPTKPIVVTTSDDRTWKMWTVPKGTVITCSAD